MAKIVTEEEYKAAKSIVDTYNDQLDVRVDQTCKVIKTELTEYFKKIYISGCKIKDFDVKNTSRHGKPSAEIVFYNPRFDEDYNDDKADDYFEALGEKHNIQLGVDSDVYGK